METIIIHNDRGEPYLEIPVGSVALSPGWIEARRRASEQHRMNQDAQPIGEIALISDDGSEA